MDTAFNTVSEQSDAPIIARIDVGDVEELQYCVDPWQLRMSQHSCGALHASFAVVQVHGILLTRERWSHKIAAMGMTPRGYLAFAGPCGNGAISWCGALITPGKLLYALDATEVDFVTSRQEDHWVMLMPLDLIVDLAGAELAAALLGTQGSLSCQPRAIGRLSALVQRSIDLLQTRGNCTVDADLLDLLEARLVCAAVACLVSEKGGPGQQAQRTQTHLAFRKARFLIEAERGRVTIEDLVAETGISRRSLEIGFREALGIPPMRYARQLRLNGLHRDLFHASPQTLTVTEAANSWGFTELGRTAGYYRELFGEVPSTTLQRDGSVQGARLADALR